MLNDLIKTAKRLSDVLAHKQEILFDFENTMNSIHCRFPYTIIVKDEVGDTTYLSWEKQLEGGKNNRIYLTATDGKGIETKKALIECQLNTRLYYIPHMIIFIDSYTEYIEKLTCKLATTSGRNEI